MELVPIGDAAKLLGLNTSALRYYENRGLVRPRRQGGKRVYSREDLRRIAFISIIHRLGLGLRLAEAVLDEPGEQWRKLAAEQLADLDELIRQAQLAQHFLRHALDCPADHPVRDCPYLVSTLDRRLAGESFEDVAANH
jgi:DNA-binding transcriptional MerR regulator